MITAAFVFICLAPSGIEACGPYFPTWLLVNTEDNILSAPLFDFSKELHRMKLAHPRFKTAYPKDPASDYPVQTLDAEIEDLLKALEQEGIAPDKRTIIAENHRNERKKISIFAEIPGYTYSNLFPGSSEPPRISGALPAVAAGLPGEFADYFRGSIVWHIGDIKNARKIWTALLERPENERRFKSTFYGAGKNIPSLSRFTSSRRPEEMNARSMAFVR
jgi:hypothetical protein